MGKVSASETREGTRGQGDTGTRGEAKIRNIIKRGDKVSASETREGTRGQGTRANAREGTGGQVGMVTRGTPLRGQGARVKLARGHVGTWASWQGVVLAPFSWAIDVFSAG